MAERDVTMRLGTELKAGGDEALRQIGRSALDAGQKTDSLFRQCNDSLAKMRENARAAGEALGKSFNSGARELERLNAQLAKFDKQYRDVAKQGLGGGLVGVDPKRLDVRGKEGKFSAGINDAVGTAFKATPFAALLHPASAALAAFTLAIKAAQVATENYYHSLEFNPKTGKAEANPVSAKQGFQRFMAENPITSFFGLFSEQTKREGGDSSRAAYQKYLDKENNRGPLRRWLDEHLGNTAPGVYTPTMSYEQFALSKKSTKQLEYDSFLARQKREFAPREAQAQASFYSGIGGLRSESTRMDAETRAALKLREESHRITGQAGTARRAAIGFAAANPRYEREQQIEDINRQIGMRQALLQSSAEGKSRQQAIGVQVNEAHGQEQFYRQKYQAAQKAEEAAKAEVEAAQSQKLGGHEIDRRAQLALAATERRKQAEESLLQSQRQSLELRKQGEQAVLQTQEQQHGILRSNLDTIQRQIEMEKRRQQSQQEKLGLMHPAQLRTALGISRKAKAGMQLTQGEIGFMQQHGDLFGKQLQQIGRQRAAAGPFAGMVQELMRNTGQTNRLQELQRQEVKIQQEIQARVVLDAGSVTDQLVKAIRPEIDKLMMQMQQRLSNEIKAISFQAWAQRRPMFPGQP